MKNSVDKLEKLRDDIFNVKPTKDYYLEYTRNS